MLIPNINKDVTKAIYQGKYVAFLANYDISKILGNNYERFDLSQSETAKTINILENKLSKQVDNNEIKILPEYLIQFFGYINENNEKIVWSNFFCSSFYNNSSVNYLEELISVDDGGNCYFNVKVNLEKEEIFDLIINGEA